MDDDEGPHFFWIEGTEKKERQLIAGKTMELICEIVAIYLLLSLVIFSLVANIAACVWLIRYIFRV